MQQSLTLVVGLGKTGLSIARHLQRHKKPFVWFDTRANPPQLASLQADFKDVPVYLEQLPESIWPQLTEVITSPGVSLDEAVFHTARAWNCPIYNDIECFSRHVKAPVIAITGTNGKSTVTTLVGEIAKHAGLNVCVAGNIGTPVLACLNDGIAYDLWVLEISSFQLELVESLKPVAATVLNITPDHLDRHMTFEAYTTVKQRVYQHAQKQVFNRDDHLTKPQEYTLESASGYCSYGLDAPAANHWGIQRTPAGEVLFRGDTAILPVSALRIQGRHNWLNALAAAALAEQAGISLTAITQGLTTFPGLSHRCEWVRKVNDVTWINDSKGTNIGATESALAGIGSALTGKIVLIAGGVGKGADFTPLRVPVAQFARAVILMGEDADKLHAALEDGVTLMHADSLEDAVRLAKNYAQPGDVVLLSPACASFDMFRDFNHRGECFSRLVNAL